MKTVKICKNCGQQTDDDKVRCPHCGFLFEEDMDDVLREMKSNLKTYRKELASSAPAPQQPVPQDYPSQGYAQPQGYAQTAQPQGDFKKAPVIDNKNYKNYINWENSAEQIERFVRALNPFISAMATFRGIFVKIYSSDAVHKKTKYPPGSVCYAKDVLGVSTGDGILEIKTLQFGSYMITDAKEFINTFKPQPGETLG